MPETTFIVGEIVHADFDPEGHPDSITVTVKCPKNTGIGHWHVVMVDAMHKNTVLRALGRIPDRQCPHSLAQDHGDGTATCSMCGITFGVGEPKANHA